jgi:hypothetical protein
VLLLRLSALFHNLFAQGVHDHSQAAVFESQPGKGPFKRSIASDVPTSSVSLLISIPARTIDWRPLAPLIIYPNLSREY